MQEVEEEQLHHRENLEFAHYGSTFYYELQNGLARAAHGSTASMEKTVTITQLFGSM